MTSQSSGPADESGAMLDVRRRLVSGMGLAPAGANVIMQLSRLPIGHAVVESKVDSGSLTKHPLKRTRTTLAYIMVALFGSERERSTLRREVNSVHRQVRSEPENTVDYDAFDAELQLWVAACMFRGVIDAATFLSGSVDEATYEMLLASSGSFATTLQVPELKWPTDHETFESYWTAALPLVSVDEVTRAYLHGLASLEFLPTWLAKTLGPSHRFLTIGFLPSTFRDVLGFEWTQRDEARFRRILKYAADVNRHLPNVVREFPWNLVEWDTRRRIARGRPVL